MRALRWEGESKRQGISGVDTTPAYCKGESKCSFAQVGQRCTDTYLNIRIAFMISDVTSNNIQALHEKLQMLVVNLSTMRMISTESMQNELSGCLSELQVCKSANLESTDKEKLAEINLLAKICLNILCERLKFENSDTSQV